MLAFDHHEHSSKMKDVEPHIWRPPPLPEDCRDFGIMVFAKPRPEVPPRSVLVLPLRLRVQCLSSPYLSEKYLLEDNNSPFASYDSHHFIMSGMKLSVQP